MPKKGQRTKNGPKSKKPTKAYPSNAMKNLTLKDKMKPMSLNCQKAIILHLSNKKRLEMSRMCPDSFAKIDAAVDQFLGHLKFTKTGIVHNGRLNKLISVSLFPEKNPNGVELEVNSETDRLGNELDIRIPRNQNLSAGDILILRTKEDKYKQGPPPKLNFVKPKYITVQQQYRCEHPNSEVIIVKLPIRRIYADELRKQAKRILFGDRVHHLESLTIDFSEGILRLPVGIQLKVKNLNLSFNSTEALKAIQPIIHSSSWPLKVVKIKVEHPEDPILMSLPNCESLVLSLPLGMAARWNILASLKHNSIHVGDAEISKEIWLAIVTDWNNHPRPIGSKFSMNSTRNIMWYMNQLKYIGGKQTVLPSRECITIPPCVTFPLNESVELNVYGTDSVYPFMEINDPVSCCREAVRNPDLAVDWMMCIEVMTKGSAGKFQMS